eukprot:8477755-Pyramimonas_sp.AAC.1
MAHQLQIGHAIPTDWEEVPSATARAPSGRIAGSSWRVAVRRNCRQRSRLGRPGPRSPTLPKS